MDKGLLGTISLPEDIKKLSHEELVTLCQEIRNKIINTVSENGGHLSSNLGVVELSVSLHRTFSSPKDKIIFDVGHQSYTHKLLTGRLDRFSTLRKMGGLSGFARPDESCHDPVVSGHSSTSISSALGIAEAMRLKGDSEHHAIAVIGDGALTGGLAYEGLNKAGKSKANIIVVVNYNEMSISKNIGAISEYLSKLRIKKSYNIFKRGTKKVVLAVPFIGQRVYRWIRTFLDVLKGKLFHSTLFEYLGFEFIGPVDGHDLSALERAFEYAKNLKGPVLVQVNTVKGKGYPPAESNPGEYHGVTGFEPLTGEKPKARPGFVQRFGSELVSLAKKDKSIIAVTAAMKYGTGLDLFYKSFPDRFFDVGIAESSAVTFCAGMSSEGLKPVFAVYSSFLQRCYDQLIHDLSISRLHCVIAVCNSGIVSEDGVTHQGLFDVPFLTTIQNVTIYSPSVYGEVDACLKRALYDDSGIVAIRLPKGCMGNKELPVCEGGCDYYYHSCGSDRLIISYGAEASEAYHAAIRLGYDFIRLLRVWPISEQVKNIINSYRQSYIFEESYYSGSIGEKLMSVCHRLSAYAIRDYLDHMTRREAVSLCGLSEECIVKALSGENRDEA